MIDWEPFAAMGVAFVAGLLIGAERDHAAEDADGKGHLGGARTHALVATAGALASLLATRLGMALVAVGFFALAALMVLAYRARLVEEERRGLTSVAAFLVTYLLGALATLDALPLTQRTSLVLGTAVVVTVALSAKTRVHSFLDTVSRREIRATLMFLAMAVLVVPLLPDWPVGPQAIVQPRQVGMFVALIMGLDLCGYIALRVLSARKALGVTGLVGGFASSTAVTISLAHKVKAGEQPVRSTALAVIIATVVSMPRAVLEVTVLDRTLAWAVAPAAGLMAAAGGVFAGVVYLRLRRREGGDNEADLRNPANLGTAVKFGLVFVAILVASHLAQRALGDWGAYAAGALGGAASLHAAGLSMAGLVDGGVGVGVAADGLVCALISSVIVKAVLASTLGGLDLAKRVVPPLLLMGGVGAGAIWVF